MKREVTNSAARNQFIQVAIKLQSCFFIILKGIIELTGLLFQRSVEAGQGDHQTGSLEAARGPHVPRETDSVLVLVLTDEFLKRGHFEAGKYEGEVKHTTTAPPTPPGRGENEKKRFALQSISWCGFGRGRRRVVQFGPELEGNGNEIAEAYALAAEFRAERKFERQRHVRCAGCRCVVGTADRAPRHPSRQRCQNYKNTSLDR